MSNKYKCIFLFFFKDCFALHTIAETNKVFTFAYYQQGVEKYIKMKIISNKR